MLDLRIAWVIWSQKDSDEYDNGGHDNDGTGVVDGLHDAWCMMHDVFDHTPNTVIDMHIWASQIWSKGVSATVAGDSDNSYFWAALGPHLSHENEHLLKKVSWTWISQIISKFNPQDLDFNSFDSHKLDLPSFQAGCRRREARCWENPQMPPQL